MIYQGIIQEIKRQSLDFKFETSGLNFANEVDFDKAYIRDDRPERLKSILEKNVEAVSTKWIWVKDITNSVA